MWYTNFDQNHHIEMFYRLYRYVQIKPRLPESLSINYDPFYDGYIDSIDPDILFIYTDGSISNGLGGYGIHFESYEVKMIHKIIVPELVLLMNFKDS